MPSGVVLVIEDDEWVSCLLANAIRDAGYEVVLCGTAEEGLSAACASEPECIICDIDLPDHDGYWVARNVRTQPSRVSVTPFLFLSGFDDYESRLQGFHVGADVYMTKPFRIDEVVAQIGALVQMASRLRHRRDSLLSIPDAAENTAIEGDLSQMSIATVLTVLEMERRSGVFEVISKKRRAVLDIAGGCILYGTVGGTRVTALAALRTMLGWKVGRFSFSPTTRDTPATRKSIAAYLLEATRLEDESARAELDLPPSRRRPDPPRVATTALGGPPATPEDVAPVEGRPRGRRRSAPPSDAPPSFDLSIELESAPPSGQRGASAGAKLPTPPVPLGRRTTIPPPPPRKPDAPSGLRGGVVATRPGPLGDANRAPAAVPQPPRPAPPRPSRPEVTKKR